MRHIPIRLGPLALLLAVISICMTTLGILTFTTSRADYVMAQAYAATVRERYELEYEGQQFLRSAGEALAEGRGIDSLSDTETDENAVTWKTIVRGENSLVIGIIPEGQKGYRIVNWRMIKAWSEDESTGELWDGEE